MKRMLCFFVLTATLAGCVEPPPLDLPHKGVTAHQILDRIKCEILAATVDNPRLITEHWKSVGALTVQVDDEGSLAATSTFINPLTAATSFAFSAGVGVTADRERIYSENFSIDINELAKKPKAPNCTAQYGNPLLGDLGITETLEIGLRSLKEGGPVDYAPGTGALTPSGGAFGETIQFILNASLTAVGPTWTLVRFKGPTGNLGGAYRKDTNKLLISFAPTPSAGQKLHPALTSFGFPGASTAEDAAAANNLLMLIQSTHGASF